MAKTTVIWMDWCDKRGPREFVEELFERLEDGGAFIQSGAWGEEGEEGFVVLSQARLSEKETYNAMARSRVPFDLEIAQEWIVDVASAVEAYENPDISAEKVNSIAKTKGFEMPNGWYIPGHKNCLLGADGSVDNATVQTEEEVASVQVWYAPGFRPEETK